MESILAETRIGKQASENAKARLQSNSTPPYQHDAKQFSNFHILLDPYLEHGKPPDVDIVLVHGLEGDAIESWTDPNSRYLWASDDSFWGFENYSVRVMAYKYDATMLRAYWTTSLKNIVKDLQDSLLKVREGCEQRPIIFVANNLGGLVVSMFLQSPSTKDVDLLKSSTHGIVFLNSPHSVQISTVPDKELNRERFQQYWSLIEPNASKKITRRDWLDVLHADGVGFAIKNHEIYLADLARRYRFYIVSYSSQSHFRALYPLRRIVDYDLINSFIFEVEIASGSPVAYFEKFQDGNCQKLRAQLVILVDMAAEGRTPTFPNSQPSRYGGRRMSNTGKKLQYRNFTPTSTSLDTPAPQNSEIMFGEVVDDELNSQYTGGDDKALKATEQGYTNARINAETAANISDRKLSSSLHTNSTQDDRKASLHSTADVFRVRQAFNKLRKSNKAYLARTANIKIEDALPGVEAKIARDDFRDSTGRMLYTKTTDSALLDLESKSYDFLESIFSSRQLRLYSRYESRLGTVVNDAKLRIQELIGRPVVFWPLSEPKSECQDGSERVYWDCPCGYEMSIDIYKIYAYTYIKTGLIKRKPIFPPNKSKQPTSDTLQHTSDSSSSQKTADKQHTFFNLKSDRERPPSYHEFPNTNPNTSEIEQKLPKGAEPAIFFCAHENKHREGTKAVVRRPEVDSDEKLFVKFNEAYKCITRRRNIFKRLFSLTTICDIRYVQFERFRYATKNTHDGYCGKFKPSVPRRSNKEYTSPYCPPISFPPLDRRELMLHFNKPSDCKEHCTEIMDKFMPKRLPGPLPTDPAHERHEAWGLQAVEGIFIVKIAGFSVVLASFTVAFAAIWLVRNEGASMQDAFTPSMLLIPWLTYFVSMVVFVHQYVPPAFSG